jgi:hypothetical protein
MKTFMTFYDVTFSCFSHRVLGVFTKSFVIYIFRFFPLNFSKIVFILYDVQIFKEECYNTNIHSDH